MAAIPYLQLDLCGEVQQLLLLDVHHLPEARGVSVLGLECLERSVMARQGERGYEKKTRMAPVTDGDFLDWVRNGVSRRLPCTCRPLRLM